jgi:hypothetical protein
VQFFEQRLRLLQIAGIEAFGEPAVDRSKQFASLLRVPLVTPERRMVGSFIGFRAGTAASIWCPATPPSSFLCQISTNNCASKISPWLDWIAFSNGAAQLNRTIEARPIVERKINRHADYPFEIFARKVQPAAFEYC